MSRLVLKVLLPWLLLLVAAAPAQAQIAFRAASSNTAAGVTPAFRSAASAVASGGTLTVTKPAGVAANDVMVAAVAVTPSSVTITPPAGWTLVRRTNNTGPTSNSLAVYYKAAGGAEPANYAWNVAGATFGVGGIQAFTGVDTANPINVENGQTTASATAHATPNVTTTVSNAMVVSSHAFASSQTWTPPAGMTESFDRPNGAANATGLSVEGARVLQAVAAATGVKTATAAGSADAGNTHILALKPANVNLTITTPTGTAAGDVLIAAIGFNNSTAVVTPPAGWTLVRRMNNASTTSNSLAVFRRNAVAGEPGSHAFAVAGGAFLVGGIQAFSGVDPANPIDVENGQTTASATAHDAPSVTTTTANAMLVTSHTFASSNTWTPQAGLTESYDRPSGATSATGQSITGGRQLQAAAGASGTKRSTAAGGADVGNAHVLALRRFVPNMPPTVGLTSPTSGANFTAPASVTLTANASDADGTIQKVEFFHGGTNLIATVTNAPYTFNWANVPQGAYALTAVATDNQNAFTTSTPANITVARAPDLHFIEVDHLNTPRLIADSTGTTVWRNDNTEPFGDSVPDENPSGLGAFEFPLRFGGWQYADKETGHFWNWMRSYAAMFGRFDQFDPIGFAGGINGYVYVANSPLRFVDPKGLAIDPLDEKLLKELGKKGAGALLGVPPQQAVNLQCANELPCGVLRHYLKDTLILDKCQALVNGSPFIAPLDKGGAIDGCMGKCPSLLEQKCKMNPNACVPGDDPNVL